MSKSEGIKCAKCGHILSLDELEKGRCNQCKKPIDETISTSFEEYIAKKHAWVNKWNWLYGKHQGREREPRESEKEKRRGAGHFPLAGLFIGMAVMAIGIVALLINFGVLFGSLWGYAWPIILIILALVFIFGRRQ